MKTTPNTTNPHVLQWVSEVVTRLAPKDVQWVEGTEEGIRALCHSLVSDGTFTALNSNEYPNSFWCRSDPSDVARVEESTFICTRDKDEVGPTNNWRESTAMKSELHALMAGSMRGRTMYVVPYLMGPEGSPYSKVGFELTDSPYVVVNMMIMARVGRAALSALGESSSNFVKGEHSVGTLDPSKRYIAHFPEDGLIISYNSNYGGNALQGKKCFALRIASHLARKEGWLAEHMFIVGVTPPSGKKHYIAGAFPSACGKTNLAMLVPPEEYLKKGWKFETVGDDIAWLNFGPDGRLYAINPEAGFFGVAPGTSLKTNPNAMATIRSNTIFTNTALDLDTMTPWWEGMGSAPKRARDWLGREWTPSSVEKAAHPNSRFTTPARQCPSIDPHWESPEGVPLSAIIFGGRRATTVPLVYRARNWQHGTYLGVTMASETTAAASGAVGKLRRDPMAMLPFIGYHAADYFAHWLSMGKHPGAKLPEIFHVNWFRTGNDGKFLWPGFGDNIRVIEWMIKCIEGSAQGRETPIGYQPDPADLNLEGLSLSDEALKALFSVVPSEWREELVSQKQFFESLGPKLPKELNDERSVLSINLGLTDL